MTPPAPLPSLAKHLAPSDYLSHEPKLVTKGEYNVNQVRMSLNFTLRLMLTNILVSWAGDPTVLVNI